jgi:hypothetical protein
MRKRNYTVGPNGDRWQVKRDGADRASSRHETQSEAINEGRRLAREGHGELRIQRPNGKIRDSDSYGRDPHLPEDAKH